jgi:hypothetical protein
MNLFLMGIVAVVALLSSVGHTNKLHRFLNKRAMGTQVVPKAITMLVMTAQVSELVKVVEHVSIVNVSAALMLLAIIIATKSGTENTD